MAELMRLSGRGGVKNALATRQADTEGGWGGRGEREGENECMRERLKEGGGGADSSSPVPVTPTL